MRGESFQWSLNAKFPLSTFVESAQSATCTHTDISAIEPTLYGCLSCEC